MGWREKWEEAKQRLSMEGEGMNIIVLICIVLAIIFVLFLAGVIEVSPIG